MTLFPGLGAVEISTLWHFRQLLHVQTPINVASFLKTITNWNVLPDFLISSAEESDDCVSKFTSLMRARD